MADLLQDLRYGARQLLANPGFTVTAVLCIALGIGANAATFSFARALLFRMPEVKEPERLVRLFIRWSSGLDWGSFSYPDYVDIRDRSDVFAGLIAETLAPLHLSTGDENERIFASVVSGNYFSELGVEMAMGRGFLPEEDRTPGAQPVVVLSHGLWQRRFGSDPQVLGRTIRINGHRFAVVGVAKKGFQGTNVGIHPELWAPILMQSQLSPGRDLLDERGNHWIGFVIGRLRPGVTADQARASTNALMASLVEEYPKTNTGKSVAVYPEAEAGLHPMLRSGFVTFLGLMFGVVGFVLLLACANVAGLLLARLSARHREIGIRLALGASRGRLLGQLLSESLLLSLLAGGAGLLFAYGLVGLIQSFRPPSDLPVGIEVPLDPIVLAFTLTAAVATAVVFGLAPALQATRQDLVSTLKEGATSVGGGASRLRQALVMGQVALSLVLLIGAALMVRSLEAARGLDLGFDPDNLLVAGVDLNLHGYDEARGRQFQKAVKERVASLPGVEVVGLGETIPLNLHSQQNGALPEGYEVSEGSNSPAIDYNTVDPSYFRAVGIPVLKGRGFEDSDDQDAPRVLVVNQTFAERFWPGQNPIGKRVRTSGEDHEVIGVVANGKYFSIGEDPKPFMYHALAQHYKGQTFVHVRTVGEPNLLISSVGREIEQLDETLPLTDLKSMHAALGFALLPSRMAAGVVSAFASLALLLAATGLYGVIAYSVSQGARDIGIRIALGARPADVLALVLRKGMTLTGVGLAVGLAFGSALAHLIAGLLYGLSPIDPASYLTALAVLAVVAFAATYLPARRAARVDPVVALRQE